MKKDFVFPAICMIYSLIWIIYMITAIVDEGPYFSFLFAFLCFFISGILPIVMSIKKHLDLSEILIKRLFVLLGEILIGILFCLLYDFDNDGFVEFSILIVIGIECGVYYYFWQQNWNKSACLVVVLSNPILIYVYFLCDFIISFSLTPNQGFMIPG